MPKIHVKDAIKSSVYRINHWNASTKSVGSTKQFEKHSPFDSNGRWIACLEHFTWATRSLSLCKATHATHR